MDICAIAAVAENGIIGKDGELPWHYPKDLEHFKYSTMNKPIIMGRKTFDSFPNPLPDRTHIVLTRNKSLDDSNDSVYYVNTPDEAIDLAQSITDDTAYIIGGQTIYELFFDDLDSMLLTEINKEYEGDTYFPEFDSDNWVNINLNYVEGEKFYHKDYNIVKYIRRE